MSLLIIDHIGQSGQRKQTRHGLKNINNRQQKFHNQSDPILEDVLLVMKSNAKNSRSHFKPEVVRQWCVCRLMAPRFLRNTNSNRNSFKRFCEERASQSKEFLWRSESEKDCFVYSFKLRTSLKLERGGASCQQTSAIRLLTAQECSKKSSPELTAGIKKNRIAVLANKRTQKVAISTPKVMSRKVG